MDRLGALPGTPRQRLLTGRWDNPDKIGDFGPRLFTQDGPSSRGTESFSVYSASRILKSYDHLKAYGLAGAGGTALSAHWKKPRPATPSFMY